VDERLRDICKRAHVDLPPEPVMKKRRYWPKGTIIRETRIEKSAAPTTWVACDRPDPRPVPVGPSMAEAVLELAKAVAKQKPNPIIVNDNGIYLPDES
jgi:hypothetical protein